MWARRNPEHHKQYYEKNKEKVSAGIKKYKSYGHGKWLAFVSQAKQRDIKVSISEEQYEKYIIGDCKYCGENPNPYNGLDRINSGRGYVVENIYSCCSRCNYMKNTLSKAMLYIHLNKIISYQESGQKSEIPPIIKFSGNKKNDYYLTPSGRYHSYMSAARKRGKHFDLTYEQFFAFWQKHCSYCGDTINTIGLDRVDNSQGYTISNVASCCTTCNSMKRDLATNDFINHVKRIVGNK